MDDEIKLTADELEGSNMEEEDCDCSGEQMLKNAGIASVDDVYDEFRTKKGLISRSDVCSIPKKYNVGNEELSAICGWEPERFPSYFEGEIPSKDDSDLLKMILADPEQFEALKKAASI